MVQYEIKISGRVQGVGFRQFIMQRARQLGIKGWVKNTVNGDVQVVAQGEKTNIDTLMRFLESGPQLARVDNVSKYDMRELSDFSGFEVKT